MLLSLLVIHLMAQAATAQPLTWTELANRPELWPTQCTLKTTIRFQGGATVPSGATVDVVSFKANEVNLKTTDSKTYFAAEPDESDALEVAGAAYDKLTPKQRALTYRSVAGDKELWPYRVTITRSLTLAPGKVVPVGDQVLVKDVLADRVDVVSEKLNARFAVTVAATDLMPQARKFVEDDQAGPRLMAMQRAAEEKIRAEQQVMADRIKALGRVVLELEGKLINPLSDQPEPLDTNALPRYIVFLRGSTTCSITRNFAPKFVKFYNQAKPAHPDFEVVYLTLDSLPDTKSFAQEMGFSWRTVTYENTRMPSLHPYIDGRIPQLIVMNRDGKVLANGIQGTAPAALEQLDTLLKQPAN